MPITLEINSVNYTNFTRASVNLALDSLSNDFVFEASSQINVNSPLQAGAPCRVLVNGIPVLTGFIERVDVSYSSDSHTITVYGRDKTSSLIDSSIDVINDLRAPISLKQIIDNVISHIGADIDVIDASSPELFNISEDIVSPDVGENAFEFVEAYAQKRQVLLTSTGDGNVLITNSEAVSGGGLIQNTINGEGNNVISASSTTDITEIFNTYIQKGQQDPVALNLGGSTSDQGIIEQGGRSVDEGVIAGRQHVSLPNKGYSNEQLKMRADWSNKIRRSRSRIYTATLQGYDNTSGNIWKINTLARIIDEFTDIDRELLINTLTFDYGISGSTTTITFVEANAYELLFREPIPVGTNQEAFSF